MVFLTLPVLAISFLIADRDTLGSDRAKKKYAPKRIVLELALGIIYLACTLIGETTAMIGLVVTIPKLMLLAVMDCMLICLIILLTSAYQMNITRANTLAGRPISSIAPRMVKSGIWVLSIAGTAIFYLNTTFLVTASVAN
ncbi:MULTISPECIES: hypothetical protein [unclassified Streptomyces]|uniref:hypothetical protein n=1 Tax=unclassified Streptomyces TaxID=2593676 RepID=UPI000B8A108E|nr:MULTISPECIES: hypothetical protein [unclassified Streptomyces]MYS19954.1 hypothetical protein [Streptomyces sp. SID4948]